MGFPTIYPTGVTIYNPEKCFNGYTVFQANELGVLVLDMNGNEVHLWEGLHGFPSKMLPNGHVMGHSGERDNQFGLQDYVDLIEVDWDGNIIWKFNQHEYISDEGHKPEWQLRQHHDYQKEGNPVGYYVPGLDFVANGNIMIMTHKTIENKKITDKPLLDDVILEINSKNEIIWEWILSDHFEELEFDEAAKNTLYHLPNIRNENSLGGAVADWAHINSLSLLGPNQWYDSGDKRFHPDNLIVDARECNIIFIIDKKTKKIVWKIGPDYSKHFNYGKKLGQIIGQHHAHMIPKGLLGEGNIIVFDNGGWAGYGLPNPGATNGTKNALRDYSRVLEFNPLTFDIVWQYTPKEAGFPMPTDSYKFYSPYISSIQRLPNGNTLIDEGSNGRIFEVTRDHEIVWEYLSPYFGDDNKANLVYRAYRVPYEWIPQLKKPLEVAIKKIDIRTFRMPNAGKLGALSKVTVHNTRPFQKTNALCVALDEETDMKKQVFTVESNIKISETDFENLFKK